MSTASNFEKGSCQVLCCKRSGRDVSRQRVKLTGAIILSLDVLVGVVVIALTTSGIGQGLPGVQPALCVPCDGLASGIDHTVNLDRRRDERGEDMCCASDSMQLSTILGQIYEKVFAEQIKDVKKRKESQLETKSNNKENDDVPLEFLSLLKPIIHLTGVVLPDKEQRAVNPSRPVPVRNWYRFGATSRMLMKNGMRLQNGSIIVPTSGLYRVYSSVKFYVETPRGNQDQPDSGEPFVHKIFRYDAANDKEVEILSNTHSKCETENGRYKEYPSYISGIVYLNTADSLTVKVSHMSELSFDSDWHYFGAHLLS